MAKGDICKVCGERSVHAQGLCAGHYSQIWRHGRITSIRLFRRGAEPIAIEDVTLLAREIAEAEELYSRVVGLAQRIYWAQKIRSLYARLAEVKSGPQRIETLARTAAGGA